MQGPDFKVGKTDIINANGDRVITETTKEQTFDGKSIWTTKQEFDYDNDGKMDVYSKTTRIYDADTGKLLEETEESNKQGFKLGRGDLASTTQEKYFYETETGRLVKVNRTIDVKSDGNIDGKYVTKYSYDKEGNLVSEKHYNESALNPDMVKEYKYHKNGEVKTTIVHLDHNQNGEFDGNDAIFENEYDQNGNLVSSTQTFQNGVLVIKYDKNNNEISREFTETNKDEPAIPENSASEEPVQGEGQPNYNFPIYQPYTTNENDIRPPMMGV